ncbi:NUDIX hydrolase [Amylibacter sp. SFDW26]|nr:NUDIX hydrolase [Amylibacter sp. SFDW26]KAB7614857.1 NUDIX hydrolase [Amylibacter sp. SFDW26]
MRRYGQSVKTDITYKHRPGVYGVILHGNEILLTHQAVPESEIQLPGGGIDPDETALQALHRECLEETGWKVQVDRRLGAYQRFTYMLDYEFWAQKICHIYLCRPVYKLQDPIEPFHTTIWTDVDDALDLISNEGDCDFLRAVLALR